MGVNGKLSMRQELQMGRIFAAIPDGLAPLPLLAAVHLVLLIALVEVQITEVPLSFMGQKARSCILGDEIVSRWIAPGAHFGGVAARAPSRTSRGKSSFVQDGQKALLAHTDLPKTQTLDRSGSSFSVQARSSPRKAVLPQARLVSCNQLKPSCGRLQPH